MPRFAPWVTDAVDALCRSSLPDGPVLAPCCGTFPELGELLVRLPGRQVIGIDLSAGMLRRARRRAAHRPEVALIRADATRLDAWTGRYAGLLSVFGLQQLPDPESAIASWAAALRPGGRLSVVYWPDTTEANGPFALLDRIVRPGTDELDAPPALTDRGIAGGVDAAVPITRPDWEARLTTALVAHGTVVETDTYRAHPIVHPSAAAFFDAYTRHGPLRAVAQARGHAFVANLRDRFLRRAPMGAWRHHPRARLIVAHR